MDLRAASKAKACATRVLSAEARYYRTHVGQDEVLRDDQWHRQRNTRPRQPAAARRRHGPARLSAALPGGTSLALLTLEERYYTDWYPFRLFHVAGAAFFDMGRTWGTDVTGAHQPGLLKDVGIGLRLGSSRSAFGNVVHVDLAFPLDGGSDIDSVQFVVETKSALLTGAGRTVASLAA